MANMWQPIRKKMSLVRKEAGVDLMIERDAENEIRVLMGKESYCLDSWLDLQALCKEAIAEMEKQKP